MNASIEALARKARRGLYPRAFHGEQSYWTLVGVDGGASSGLFSEDGAIELAKGGPSVEPFVVDEGRLVTWADASISQSLDDGYLPIPSVTWRRAEWELRITTFAVGDSRRSGLVARYTLRNLTPRRRSLVLALAVRPLQVDGPEQFLNSPGGFSPIRDLTWDGRQLTVNGRAALSAAAPERFAPIGFDEAVTADELGSSGPGAEAAHDGRGLASGALIYSLSIAGKASATVGWAAPLANTAPTAPPTAAELDREEAAVASAWRARLGAVTITLPRRVRAVANTVKTSLAYMLLSRNGPVLRPGTRSYDRSWIRDGAMISDALLRLGQGDVAADYLRWYAPFQFPGGKVPCCVDGRGADPTPENDSQGEFIFLAAEVYRYGGDKALLRAVWPRVEAAADYMDGLRRSERTAANQAAGRRMLYGLMPPSISHEGYSGRPAYSYWDDFWSLTGYADAMFIARTLGDEGALSRLTRSHDEFRRDLLASVRASARAHGVDYIPGAADLGDFDATSTTVALSPGGEGESLPRDLLDSTFERYWRQFTDRRDADRTWDAYTPYELRSIGVFVRLGRRDRAGALLDFFMKDRRPLAWNGWAEVVGREARKPRFIGDLPHAWVASDYVRSVLDMFAYERNSDHALVVAAGIPPDWFDGAGVGIHDLRTPYGRLTWTARLGDHLLTLRVSGTAHPPGGYVFPWPFAGVPGPARFKGHAVAWRGGALRLDGPGEVVIEGGWGVPRPHGPRR
ncbi:MAG: hypothetical protein ACYC8V_03735 [Caulobacteraceae bacterium]